MNILSALLIPLLISPVYAVSPVNEGRFELKTAALAAKLKTELAAAGVSSANAAASAAAPEQKECTFILFMNGKSNVEPFALEDFNELETVGSTDKVNVVVELGRMRGQDNDFTGDGDWTGVRRYLVKKDADTKTITSPVLLEKQADMGKWQEAADFLAWAKTNFPAKRYIFLIWDHGWGWLDPGAGAAKPAIRSISHDFESGSFIKTEEMKNIFKSAGPVSVYASMACFMQMFEVAYEIKDYAEVIIGSEEVIQLPSFDFGDILARLNSCGEITSEGIGAIFVDSFHKQYTTPEMLAELEQTKYGVQLSAIRANKLPPLLALLDGWTEAAIASGDTAALKAAKHGVLRFEVGDETTDPQKLISFYGDLYNFVELFDRNLASGAPSALHEKSAALLGFLSGELVVKNAFASKDRTGKDYSNAHGLGIHIPGEPGTLIEIGNDYSALQFAKSGNWPAFVKYLEALK